MKIFVPILLVLCFTTSSFAITCYHNNTQSGAIAFAPNDTVGQHIAGAYITESLFTGAALFRADSTPVSGTFYVIPGQNSNTTEAIFSTAFSSSSGIIYANGTVALTVNSSYTFLWVRDSTGNSTDVWQADDWLADSNAFAGSFTNIDQAGEFCFATANNVPTHSIVGISVSNPNTVVSNPVQTIRANQYYRGVPLVLYVSDFDLETSGNMTVNVSLANISGMYPAYFGVSDMYVEVLAFSNELISLWGPQAEMRDTISRFKVYWGASVPIRYMITFKVSDHGQSGVCADTGAYPCVLWTSSTTVFAT